MRDVSRSWRKTAGSLLLLTPLAALLLGGCQVVEEEGGYPKVVDRRGAPLPPVTNPPPPPVTATAAALGSPETLDLAALPEGVTQEMVEEGQRLYGSVCVACHGAGGAGSTIAPALNDPDWIHITGELPEIEQIIRAGVQQPQEYPAAMPPMGGGNFDAEQLRAISSYVYAISRSGT